MAQNGKIFKIAQNGQKGLSLKTLEISKCTEMHQSAISDSDGQTTPD